MNAQGGVVCEFLNIPDKILVEIILYLNAKERVILSKTCKKLNSIVFTNKELLKDLKFPNENITSVSDIQQYFENKKTYKHVQTIRVNNFDPRVPNHDLFRYISRATNLVEIDIAGTKFKDIRELGTFLRLLQHVNDLCISWPNTASKTDQFNLETLRKPFGRLKFLRVHFDDSGYSKTFIRSLQLCQELIKLKIFGEREFTVDQLNASSPWSVEPRILRNLKIVVFCGPSAQEVKTHITTMLPNPEEWRDISEASPPSQDTFYLIDKNFERIGLEAYYIEDIPYLSPLVYFKERSHLPLKCFLRKLIENTDTTEPKELCCLSDIEDQKLCVLKMDDAKLLLEYQEHEIPYLTLNHDIEPECDAHLFASAFPEVTELILSNIIKSKVSPPKNMSDRRIRGKKHVASDEGNQYIPLNVNTSFKKLVANTPKIRSLTIHARDLRRSRTWDLGALYLIGGWKSLRTLCLSCIPITNGNFLIEIVKECKHLEELKLSHLGRDRACCYTNELPKMLSCCYKLKELTIHQENIGQVSVIFSSLVNSPKLESIHVTSSRGRDSTIDLIRSVKQLLRYSSKLIQFICIIDGIDAAFSENLTSTLRRLRRELKRPNLQLQVVADSLIDLEDNFATPISDLDSTDSDSLELFDSSSDWYDSDF